jgi:hypothetical protein
MQSVMQMFVARFASKDPRICATTDAKQYTTNICDALCVCATTDAGGEFKHQVQQAKLEGPL